MLKLSNLCKFFSEELVLDNVTLEVEKGTICALMGANGSGKSTLMKCISGEYEVSSGKMLFSGCDVTKSNTFRMLNTSTVTQDIASSLVGEMTVFENILLAVGKNRSAGLRFISQDKEMISDILSEVDMGLEKRIYDRVANLSGGQKQAIATVMAMINMPPLILLDEHTSALDVNTQQKILSYTLSKSKRNSCTVIMITHSIMEAMEYGERIIVLSKGKLKHDVSLSEKSSLTFHELSELLREY
ncbi:ABC-transporter ATP-binding protein [Candidatus Fokinia solitaria]|uniref:ABC-transporter ATP-binding protein n=1 Tax=Candidatus Fokinia solitaria TaxID=1802984 RepID=A0A2U8BRN1_9RICK|nr:ATP-binding cassette domain-containing protein [Candidatus Fokinia solitaria]AWD32988.1 ABC-transporter ATP-binding protein [Candidatus Fokinia solitaria]